MAKKKVATKTKSVKKRLVKCKCFKLTNEALAEQGVTLASAFQFNFNTGKATISGPFLSVKWIGGAKRGKSLPMISCTYCPICGKKAVL